MSRVERFFERLVERPSSRVFRAPLRPVQLLRRIERAMEAGRGAGGRPSFVPDQFTVRLHPKDLAGLVPAEDVARDLASGALRFARAHAYALRDRPRVRLAPDPRVAAGSVEVDASVSATPSIDAGPADGGTRVFQVPIVRSPPAVLQVVEPGRAPRRVTVSGEPVHVGRAPECDLVLRDSKVSRRHARLTARDGVLVLADLGSMNGTFVNGHRVSEVALGAGDRVVVGETTLILESTPGEGSQGA